ncbi:hypothetical protein ABT369_39550 [Dactylosporangium sp. NPDC000244]|uniref:hypothetical protein n=1 Tax=Dactylosporangium sp. NPDC000244 TaxID=3154365 RepID=UPI0033183FCA
MTTWTCGCVLPRGPFCDDHRREFFGVEPVSEVDRFLMLLRDNPTLLDPAPGEAAAAAMQHRAQDEIHTCLRCGERSKAAVIAATKIGPRWLDVCWGCYNWIQLGATPARLWPRP